MIVVAVEVDPQRWWWRCGAVLSNLPTHPSPYGGGTSVQLNLEHIMLLWVATLQFHLMVQEIFLPMVTEEMDLMPMVESDTETHFLPSAFDHM